MPKQHEPPLLLELKQSERLKQLLVLIHLLALGSSIANALPIMVKLILVIFICLNFWFMTKQTHAKDYKIKHTEGSGWELDEGKNFEAIDIGKSTVLTTFAIFLHFKQKNKKQSLLILNDMLTEDDYRRLIVRLKTIGKNKINLD